MLLVVTHLFAVQISCLLVTIAQSTVKPTSIISEGTANKCGEVIYMGNVQGPEKVNDTCVKTLHA
jgi:hypothetical protein